MLLLEDITTNTFSDGEMMSLITIWLAAITDIFWGDPNYRYHPVRIIGNAITFIEKKLRKHCLNDRALKIAGIFLTILIVLGTYFAIHFLIAIANKYSNLLATFISIFLIYSFLALQSLVDAANGIYYSLKDDPIAQTRHKLSMIVGRDTQQLNEQQITKATVETVAENSVDGVIAPLFFLFIGGVPLMAAYKAINTLDSMVGYQNSHYKAIGWCSAKLDDIANYIPARLSLLFITLSALLLKLDYKNAWKIGRRDCYQHKSPNSAWSEATVAGALNIQLGGGNYYHGIYVDKPTIGDDIHPVQIEHIKQTNHLIYGACTIALVSFTLIFLAVQFIF